MMNKKQTYARHGIEYSNGKILYHGKWVAELLKEGNSKTGKKFTHGQCWPERKELAYVIAMVAMQ